MFKEETTKKMEHKLKQVVGEVYGYKLLRMYKKLRFRIHGWCYDPIRENEWRDPYYASKYRPGGGIMCLDLFMVGWVFLIVLKISLCRHNGQKRMDIYR